MSLHLLISAGRGPRECAWAVAELARRLQEEAADRGVGTQRVHSVPGERPGTLLSVLLELTGAGAAELAAAWTGTLCWQAPSPFRTTGRKNWYVIAQPCQLDAPRTAFDETDVVFTPVRTGGPGGQHRNKASTAVRATHRPSGLVVVVDTERQLSLNRRIAVELLRRRLEEADESAGRAAITARWRIHDDLVRGDPVRVERPGPARAQDRRGSAG
jgi:peptide chain release factor